MVKNPQKTVVSVSLSEREREIVVKAAEKLGLGISSFLRMSSMERAKTMGVE